jgi:quinol-cytochrome oxidoreductase complex cytochrome b subunit
MIIIIIMLTAIWIVIDFMDNSPTESAGKGKSSGVKALIIVLIVLVTMIVGSWLIIWSVKKDFNKMFDSCCETAQGVGRIG